MMKKTFIFLLSFCTAVMAGAQVLAPAADGHILRIETWKVDETTHSTISGPSVDYITYFSDLYVGGELSFSSDWVPGDGEVTYYNRELKTILEFDISSLSLTPGNYTAYLDIVTDGKFWPPDPVSPFGFDVQAVNLADAQENGVIQTADYAASAALLDTQFMDGETFPLEYSFNVTAGLEEDLNQGGNYAGFILQGENLNGYEISLVDMDEESLRLSSGPRLRIVGVQPDISVGTGTCQDTAVGSSRSIPVTVTNAGTADLVIDDVLISNNPSGAYSLDLGALITTIAPSNSSTFSIIFTPPSQGSFTGTFRIDSNDPDENPYIFQMNCNGTAPGPEIDVSVESCGTTTVGDTTAITVNVSNFGTQNLTISSVDEIVDSSGFFTLDLTGFNTTIAPSGSSSFAIDFSPGSAGSYFADYVIHSNDSDEGDYDFAVSCTSVSADAPDIAVTPYPAFIPGVPKGTLETVQVTLKNEGITTLNISNIQLASGAVFSLDTSATDLSLNAGEETNFSIGLQASKTGYYHTTVTITSNDPDEGTFTLPVHGTVTMDGLHTGAIATGDPATTVVVTTSAVARGALGAYWVTDIKAFNTSDQAMTYTVYYIKSGQGNASTTFAVMELEPRQTMGITNILESLFGFNEDFGALLFVPSRSGLRIASRTYTPETQPEDPMNPGTYGQYIPGVLLSSAFTSADTAYLPGLSKNVEASSATHTNIGFVNLSNVPASLNLSIYNGSGVALVENYSISLAEYSHRQINFIFGATGATPSPNAYAVITINSGVIMGFASLVDDNTKDPIYIPAQ